MPRAGSKRINEFGFYTNYYTLPEISADMRKFECYVKYLAGWDILVSTTNRYQGALQYLTDRWGEEVVCVMISLKDAYTYMSLESFQQDTEEIDWTARIHSPDAE